MRNVAFRPREPLSAGIRFSLQLSPTRLTPRGSGARANRQRSALDFNWSLGDLLGPTIFALAPSSNLVGDRLRDTGEPREARARGHRVRLLGRLDSVDGESRLGVSAGVKRREAGYSRPTARTEIRGAAN